MLKTKVEAARDQVEKLNEDRKDIRSIKHLLKTTRKFLRILSK